jgi:hypothetical protein
MSQTKPEIIEPPVAGAFPGYDIGLKLFSTWTLGMKRQADIWNGAWTKARSGKYTVQDWFAAVSESIEAGAESVERAVSKLSPNNAPPWVGATWPLKTDLDIKIRAELAPDEVIRFPPMSRLGGDKDGTLPVLEGTVSRLNAYTIRVDFKKPSGNLESGQYVGFVLSDRRDAPLAIVAIQVP